jgi:hypothetical protein
MVVGRPFQPGQSGNPNGRPKTRPFKDALRKAIEAAGDDNSALKLVAAALLAKAQEGDVPAIKEIADRLDGKVAQPISGDDEGDAIKVIHKIERVIVSPPDQNG